MIDSVYHEVIQQLKPKKGGGHKLVFLPVLYVDEKLVTIGGVKPCRTHAAADRVGKKHAKACRESEGRLAFKWIERALTAT